MSNDLPKPAVEGQAAQNAGELLSFTLAGSGVQLPLDEVFLALADDVDSPKMRRVSVKLAEHLRRGADLPTAMRSVQRDLPPYLQRALVASAAHGQTAAVIAGLAAHEVARRRIRRKLQSILLYPAIVVALLLAVVSGITMFPVRDFQDIYADFGLSLPKATEFVLTLGQVIPWVLAGLVSAALAYFALTLWPGAQRWLHWLRTGLPLLGRIWIWSGQHEFASVLGALAAQRVVMDDALACTVDSLSDRNLARAAQIVARKCREGATLVRGMSESIHFDPSLTALVGWGEVHDSLPAALRQATQTFEEELDAYASFLSRVVPPILFVSVMVVLGFIVMALFVPLVDLINNLSG
jgi:type II secretory pathway component PulF